LKPAGANSSQRPYLKKCLTHKKRTGGVVQGVGPEFKPLYHQKKKKREREREREMAKPGMNEHSSNN
jgi:hypothetical protein